MQKKDYLKGGIASFLQSGIFKERDFNRANLNYANLSGANLEKADFRNAILRKINLSRANLSGANLERVNLKDANLRGIRPKNSSILNSSFELLYPTIRDKSNYKSVLDSIHIYKKLNEVDIRYTELTSKEKQDLIDKYEEES